MPESLLLVTRLRVEAAQEVVVLVHALAPRVDTEDAALAEPAAVAYRALRRAGPRPGCRALVIGDGTVALLAVHLLGLWSPSEVVVLGLRPEQSGLAKAAGATRWETDSAVAGGGYDLVVACGVENMSRVPLGSQVAPDRSPM